MNNTINNRSVDRACFKEISESIAQNLCNILNEAFHKEDTPWRVVFSCSEPRPRILISDYRYHDHDFAGDTWERVYTSVSNEFDLVSEVIAKIATT